ncbi:MAG: hypothetical protein WD876_03430 [Candidatus Pacearchaeota archaeon]
MSYLERHEKRERSSKYILFGVLTAAVLSSYLLISGCPERTESQQEQTPAKKLGLERVIYNGNPVKQI